MLQNSGRKIFRVKKTKQTSDSRRFLMLKCFQKWENCIIGPCQQTRKVQCMYLPLKNLKISGKNVEQCSQSLKQSPNDAFRS